MKTNGNVTILGRPYISSNILMLGQCKGARVNEMEQYIKANRPNNFLIFDMDGQGLSRIKEELKSNGYAIYDVVIKTAAKDIFDTLNYRGILADLVTKTYAPFPNSGKDRSKIYVASGILEAAFKKSSSFKDTKAYLNVDFCRSVPNLSYPPLTPEGEEEAINCAAKTLENFINLEQYSVHNTALDEILRNPKQKFAVFVTAYDTGEGAYFDNNKTIRVLAGAYLHMFTNIYENHIVEEAVSHLNVYVPAAEDVAISGGLCYTLEAHNRINYIIGAQDIDEIDYCVFRDRRFTYSFMMRFDSIYQYGSADTQTSEFLSLIIGERLVKKSRKIFGIQIKPPVFKRKMPAKDIENLDDGKILMINNMSRTPIGPFATIYDTSTATNELL